MSAQLEEPLADTLTVQAPPPLRVVSSSLTQPASEAGALRHVGVDAFQRWITRSAKHRGLEGTYGPVVQTTAASILWTLLQETQATPPGEQPTPWVHAQLFALPDRGLQLEWHAGNDHVEIAIEIDGSIGLHTDSGGDEHDFEIEPHREPIPRVVVQTLRSIFGSVA